MLFRSGLIVAFLTLISRFVGLARDLFIAASFGSSAIGDCVNIAFKFPNLFRRLFGEGALSSVFIPIFSKKLVESPEAAKKFSSEVFTLLLIILLIISTLLQIFMPYLMCIIAPGFYENPEKNRLAILLCQITTPYLVFVCIVALFGGMLNSVKKFAAFAFSPVIMNVSVIGFTLILSEEFHSYYSVAWSLIIAGILQLLFMIMCLKTAGLGLRFSGDMQDPDVKIMLKNMWPASLSAGAQQINLFISQSIATFAPGAVSILSYADRLYQLPLSLIGVSVGTILLPELSRMYKEEDIEGANDLLNRSIMTSCIIAIPATFGLFVLAGPIIHFLYERGAFTNHDTQAVALSIQAFAIGLPAFVLAKILTPIFYANLDIKRPFRIMLYSIALNIILNILLMIPFSYVGIAFGSSVAGWFNVCLLARGARVHGDFRIGRKTFIFAGKAVLSAIGMSLFIIIVDYIWGDLFYIKNFMMKGLFLFGVIMFSVLIFAALCFQQKLHLEIRKER